MPIGHRGGFQSWRLECQLFFRATRRRADARNLSFRNSSTQLRKPYDLLIKPHYCAISPTDTATQFLQKLAAFVQFGISHIEGCERELLRCMLYILLEANHLISVIHFPFVRDDYFPFLRKLSFFFKKRSKGTSCWNFAEGQYFQRILNITKIALYYTYFKNL